jgi:hypothetical protein
VGEEAGTDTSVGHGHSPCLEGDTLVEGVVVVAVVYVSDVALTEHWMHESATKMCLGRGHPFSARCNWGRQAGCAVCYLLEVADRSG